MAGLPQTLAGVIGLVAFIAFITGLMAFQGINTNNADLQNKVTTFQSNLNGSIVNATDAGGSRSGIIGWITDVTGTSGIASVLTWVYSVGISFISMGISFISNFINVITSLPTPFFVVVLVISISFIVGLLKLLLLSGD